MSNPPGIVIAAPSSNSGKTVVTLALARALARRTRVHTFKVGPDYLDPMLLAAASGHACGNLDPFAMSDASLGEVLGYGSSSALHLVEGVMGLFDGGDYSTAAIAKRCGWPVVLLVNTRGMSQSIAALVKGFCEFDRSVNIGGVILNNVGSPRHEALLREALQAALPSVAVLGALPRLECMTLPRRHLGLVQASELPQLTQQLDACADAVESHCDLTALTSAARPHRLSSPAHPGWVPSLGAHIAIASDDAFGFVYAHWRQRWQQRGVSVQAFSPLADDPLPTPCTGVFLPGGYPELHLKALGAATRSVAALRHTTLPIYAECGGMMWLGEQIVDAQGVSHTTLGRLPLQTSFATRRLQLGYRKSVFSPPGHEILGGAQTLYSHEFHYSALTQCQAPTLSCDISDLREQPVTTPYFTEDKILASYAHAIDAAPLA